MPTIVVDGREFVVEAGKNLLHVCLSLGINLPYFCWHPAMGSVGACRQCAVKQFRDESDQHGKLVMACMTAAADGTRISITDAEAHLFRERVAAWMMVNHPHDCPVCDEGGECHLQDMIVMTGHNYRHYAGLKRTFVNQDLGPFVNHEMNRCIQCYRCVRFYRGYAGGRDFDAFSLRNLVYFGRAADGTLESEFSGNLVEVCPTGVFDDKTFKEHYTRKWDLQTAPSVCVHCSLGCNTIPGERYGMLRRIRNRYNGEVNGYFLCDRGRYGYEFVNSERRLRHAMLAGPDGGLVSTDPAEAVRFVGGLLAGGVRPIGIGSPRASLEANFALRSLVGPERFFMGVADAEAELLDTIRAVLMNGPAPAASLHDVELADAVFVLGEDVSNVAPMLALALRQSVRYAPMKIAEQLHIPDWDDAAVREAVQHQKGPLFIASLHDTRLDDVATETYRAAPDDLARLGFAVAQALDEHAPAVPDLPDGVQALAVRIAQALRTAERPLIVSGVSCLSEAVIKAAANVARALSAAGRSATQSYTVPECNSMGLALLGGAGGQDAALRAVRDGQADTVIILENDLYRHAETAALDALLREAKHVIAIDQLLNPTTLKAGVVLPAATFAEGDGTLVNNEGRAQRFYQVFVPEGAIKESWRWLRDLAAAAGRPGDAAWRTLDEIDAALTDALPVFAPVREIAPSAGFRIAGQRVARAPHRYSGRTAMQADVSVHEPQPPEDPDSPLAFSMEGFQGEPPAALIPRFWAPGWNSVQALNKFQEEVGGPLRGGDPGRRLIEPAPDEQPAYFSGVPPAFRARSDEWLLVPIHHIFGSEELSVLTPGVAQLSPPPYLGLNPTDAERLKLADGDAVELPVDSGTQRLPVKRVPALPVGVAGYPVGLPGMPWLALPAWKALRSVRG